MANIELHSFLGNDEDICNAIWGISSNPKYADFQEELVVTIVTKSFSKDKHGRVQPFVRVFFTRNSELETCKEILAQVPNLYKCFFDAEFVKLSHFRSFPPKSEIKVGR